MTHSSRPTPPTKPPIPLTTSDTPPAGSIVGSDTSVAPGGRATAPSDAPSITQLKHYRLLELIGRGGMGDVYRAHDEMFNRTVAVKVLPADLADDEQFVRRFQREAKAIAGLSHPNIIPVYGSDRDQGVFFYAMQFIVGESLDQRLRRQRTLSLHEALAIITACLSALEAAHAQGLIHRDVKPGNVLLQEHSDHVYLVDFGLVRRVDGNTSDRTITGMVMGTVDYMAPEQARGVKDIDHRADLYAIGAMLYHLLSGRLPFDAQSFSDKLYSHAYESPLPLVECAPHLPNKVVQLIEHLMAKKPADRPANCRVVIEALAPLRAAKFRTSHVTEQLHTLTQTPAEPTGFNELPESYTPWQRFSDRAASFIQARSPAWLARYQSLEKQVDGEVARVDRRQRHLHALHQEGQQLLVDLKQQRRETQTPNASLDDQIASLDEQLLQLDFQLAEAKAQHAGLVNRRNVLSARLHQATGSASGKQSLLTQMALGGAAALCLILLFLFVFRGSTESKGPPEVWVPPPPADKIMPSEWVDLMSLIDPTRDAINGQWRFQSDGSLRGQNGQATLGHARLQIPVYPQGTYEIEASISRRDSDINLLLPVGDHSARVSFGYRDEGSIVSHVGGEHTVGAVNRVSQLEQGGAPRVVRVVVNSRPQQASIQVFVDGKPTSDWSGDSLELANNAPCAIPDHRALGLTVSFTEGTYHSLRFRMLSGHADLILPRRSPSVINLDRGLAAHYKFNEGQGLYAHDSVGNYDGRLNGAKWAKGFDDGALYFSPNKDDLSVPTSFIREQANYTITAWALHHGQTSQFHVHTAFSGPYILSSFRLDSQGFATSAVWTPQKWLTETTEQNSVATGKWCFMAARFSSTGGTQGTMKMWVDGRVVERPFQIIKSTANNSRIGYRGGGLIEDLRIYLRAISDEEVEAIYALHAAKAKAANDYSELAGVWTLEEMHQGGRSGPDPQRLFTFEPGRFRLAHRGSIYQAGSVQAADSDSAYSALDLKVTDGNNKGKEISAIYRIEGDTLHYCSHMGGPAQRPRSFGGSGYSVWRRASRNSTVSLPIMDPSSELAAPLSLLNAKIAANPRSQDLYITRGYWYAVRGRWQEACVDLERSLTLREDMWWCRTNLARIYLYLNDHEGYGRHCEYLLTQFNTDKRDDKRCHMLRPLYLDGKRWAQQLAAVEPEAEGIASRLPNDYEVLLMIAGLRYARGRWQDSIDAVNLVCPQAPTYINNCYPWCFRVMSLHQLGKTADTEVALRDWKKHIEGLTIQSPTDADYAKLPLDTRLQHFAFNGLEAQIVYRQASELVFRKREELALSPAYIDTNRPETAFTSKYHQPRGTFDAAVGANSNNPAAYLERSRWYAVRQQWPEAIADCEAYLKLSPGDHVERANLATMYLLANDLAGHQRHAERLARALATETRSWRGACLLHALLSNSQITPAHLDTCDTALARLSMNDPNTQLEQRRALVLYRQQKWDECVKAATKAVPGGLTHPSEAALLIFKSMALQQLGKATESKAELEKIKLFFVGRTVENMHFSPSSNEQRMLWWTFDALNTQVAYREASELLGKREELLIAPAVDPQRTVAPATIAAAEQKPYEPVAPVYPTEDKDGKQDFALSFDGSAHVELPLWYDGSHPLSIEAYVTPLATDRVNVVIANVQHGGLGIDVLGTPPRWSFPVNDGISPGLGYQRVSSDDPMALGKRVHVAVVLNDNQQRLYVDGKVQTMQPPVRGIKPSTMPFFIGADPDKDFRPENLFYGVIDEVRVSRSARYTADFTPVARFTPDAQTLALYHFDEGSGNRLNDASGNGRHGTIQNAKWIRADATPALMTPRLFSIEDARKHWHAGDLKQARAGYERWLRQSPDSHYELGELAALCLALGDDAAYREHCRALLARAPRISNAGDRVHALRVLCLVPDVDPDLAKRFNVNFDNNEWQQRSLMLWLYRTGQWQPAAQQAQSNSSVDSPSQSGKVQSLLVHAMTTRQQGDREAAKMILTEAEQLAQQPIVLSPTQWSEVPNRLYAEILFREATKLIDGTKRELTWASLAPPDTVLPLQAALTAHARSIAAVTVAPKQGYAITGDRKGAVHVWDVTQRKHLFELTQARAEISVLNVSPDGRYLAIGTSKGDVELWDLNERLLRERWPQAGAFVRSLEFTPDSKRLLIAGKHIYEWPLRESASVIRTFAARAVFDLAFTQDGQFLIAGAYNNGQVAVFDVASGKLLHEFPTSKILHRIDLSPDEQTLLVVGGEQLDRLEPGTVQIWDWKSKTRLKNFVGHTGFVSDGCFTPDGRNVVSGGMNDRTLRVWNVATEREVARATSEFHCFSFLEVTSDGQQVLTGGGAHFEFGKHEDDGDSRFYFWDLAPLGKSALRPAVKP